ncbi:hypothetical protein KEF29_28980 [Streptomyces tuirus]|uniref:DUF5753 domain-containing protein n=1 Tax=Streptomyces tuirus TaxID=68278 RepID=A0A941FCG9_9ACTN|nr:hypothetical protein [Streptomyces tuirus]
MTIASSGMAEQLDHLQAMAQRPNVDVQVLQFTAGAHAAGSCAPSWSLDVTAKATRSTA